jgi:hypothetical protein
MKQQNPRASGRDGMGCEMRIPRRKVVTSCVLVLPGVLSALALGRESAERKEGSGPSKDFLERMEQSRVFSERMRSASSMEERTKIMEERDAWERARAVDDLKRQLEVSDQEWSVIKPRVEAVYNLMHPQPQFSGPGNTRPANPVDRGKGELREVLGDKNAPAEQIKAKLTALRAAQVNVNQELAKARQNLRQIMTLRQEATLVLNGLLD